MKWNYQISRTIVLIVVVGVAISQRAKADILEVNNWVHQSQVGSFSPGPPAGGSNVIVQNPYVADANFIYPQSPTTLTQTHYDYGWNDTSAHFNLVGHQRVRGGNLWASNNTNLIRIRPLTEILVVADGQYTYSMPQENGRRTQFHATISAMNNSIINTGGQTINSNAINPVSGVISYHFEQVLAPLPAGQYYQLIHGFALDSNSPSSAAALSVGDGFSNFTITATPEPGSLGLLCIGLMALKRRRR